jgi:hypothetical protein
MKFLELAASNMSLPPNIYVGLWSARTIVNRWPSWTWELTEYAAVPAIGWGMAVRVHCMCNDIGGVRICEAATSGLDLVIEYGRLCFIWNLRS